MYDLILLLYFVGLGWVGCGTDLRVSLGESFAATQPRPSHSPNTIHTNHSFLLSTEPTPHKHVLSCTTGQTRQISYALFVRFLCMRYHTVYKKVESLSIIYWLNVVVFPCRARLNRLTRSCLVSSGQLVLIPLGPA